MIPGHNTHLIGVINERQSPVLLLDLLLSRGRSYAQDSKRIETLDVRVIRHRVQHVDKKRPPREQRHQLRNTQHAQQR